jgi:hypothetical protein
MASSNGNNGANGSGGRKRRKFNGTKNNGGNGRRSSTELALDRMKIARMLLRGRTGNEIAQELGLAVSTISKDKAVIEEQWFGETMRNVDEMRANRAAELREVRREAWDEYERSKTEATRKSQRMKRRPAKTPGNQPPGQLQTAEMEVSEDKIERIGQPRFLQIVISSILAEAKLFGLDMSLRPEELLQASDRRFDVTRLNPEQMVQLDALLVRIVKPAG